MNVLKFGGTSVGSAQRIQEVAKLISDDQPKIVVLSQSLCQRIQNRREHNLCLCNGSEYVCWK